MDVDRLRTRQGVLKVTMESLKAHYVQGYSDDDIIFVEDIPYKRDQSPQIVKLDAVLMVFGEAGTAEMEIDEMKYTLSANDLLLVGPNHLICQTAISSDFRGSAAFLSVRQFQGLLRYERSVWERAFYVFKNPLLHLTPEQKEYMKSYRNLLRLKMQNSTGSYHKEVMRSLVQALFYDLLSMLDSLVVSTDTRGVRQGDILFRRFMELLSAQEVKPRFVYWYADKLNVSTKYLSAVCKSVSGKTATDIINAFVIEDIRQRLEYSDKSIKEIAQELDFPSISFFGKYVKSHLGVSPKEYRKG